MISPQSHQSIDCIHVQAPADDIGQTAESRLQVISGEQLSHRGQAAADPQSVDKPPAKFVGIEYPMEVCSPQETVF
jgi:hypothetical protein